MNSERRDSLGYECSCHVFTDPKESLCRFCLPRREEWEDERAREQAEIDLEADAHAEPPRAPKGDSGEARDKAMERLARLDEVTGIQ